MYFVGDYRVVGVVVSVVVVMGGQDIVQQGFVGDYEIQLVLVMGFGVLLRYFVVRFCGEECVCDVEVMEGVQFEEMLFVFVEFVYVKVVDVLRLGGEV